MESVVQRQRKPWFLASLSVSFLLFVTFSRCDAHPLSNPIVDVRFEGSYRQVLPSEGDEWAPTWGRDGVLYTANNDGSSFGGVPANSIGFGKLEGDDPRALSGKTINGMAEYREPPYQGPESAQWRRVDTYELDGVRYALVPCRDGKASCLTFSNDSGKTWDIGGERGRILFESTKFTAPFFIVYGGKYSESRPDAFAYAASYAGVLHGEDSYFVGRVPKTSLMKASVSDWSFMQADWSWRPDVAAAVESPNNTNLGSDGGNWKTMNTYSVDGVLYMFVTRCFYPSGSRDPKRRHIFQNSSIIKSTDNGETWTRSAAENLRSPMFPGKRFGTAYFVWYGKDGAANVDNADQYVYAVSNNGHFENGDDYAIGRVSRSRLPHLSAADWSFYRGGDGMQDSSWTPELNDAQPILREPGKLSMTGMTYIEDLRRYVMVSWHYNHENYEASIKAKDLSTVLEFFEAEKPWGPWTKVKEYRTGGLGWFAPIIGQRFQKRSSPTSVEVFLYAPGLKTRTEGGLDSALYKLNFMPITLSTRALDHVESDFVGGR